MGLRGRRSISRHTVPQLVALAVVASQVVAFAVTVGPMALAAAPGTIHEFRPVGISQTVNSDPVGITAGPDGNLWFTDSGASTIGKVSTSGTGLQEFKTKTGGATPVAITPGSDGNLWFTELSSSVNQVGRINTAGTTLNEYGIDKKGALPAGIVTGPDSHLWITDFGNGTIATINPSSPTTATTFAITMPTLMPQGIASGPNGHLWFTEQGSAGGKIGEMDTSGTQVSDAQAASSSGAGIDGITVGPDGNLWFTEQSHAIVGSMTPGHLVHEYHITGSAPSAITTGTDGALWFVDVAHNAIGRITTAGVVNEFTVPTPHAFSPNIQPTSITSGPDGNIWFTEQDTKAAIGTIVVGNPVGAVTASPSSLDFGDQAVGTTSTAKTVTLTNGTTDTVHVSTVAISGANFAKSGDTCTGKDLSASGGSCTVGVTFGPTSAGGKSATLTFTETTGNPQTVALTGNGTTPGGGGGCDNGLLGLLSALLRLLGLLPPCS